MPDQGPIERWAKPENLLDELLMLYLTELQPRFLSRLG